MSQNKDYNIFLDDQSFEINEDDGSFIRDPKNYYPKIEFIKFTKASDAIQYMKDNGCPKMISFDHDLHEFDSTEKELTGLTVAQWLIEQDLDTLGKFIHPDFKFMVHSANPIGKENIEKLLIPYLRYRSSN